MKINIQRSHVVILLLIVLAAVSYFFFFYKSENAGSLSETPAPPVDALPLGKKVDLKSVIITMKSTKPMLGSDVETKVYIDDYGKKYCTVTDTKMDYKGTPIVTTEISIIKEGFTYTYDPDKKSGVKSINKGDFNPTKIDFAKLDPQMMSDHGIKKLPNEIVLGKVCEVYTITYPALDMNGRYDVWQTIPLHTKTHLDDFDIEMIATNIEENVTIPPSRFELPRNVIFNITPGDSTSTALPPASGNQ